MLTSDVKEHNGIPTLFVDGKPYPACAYMTYLEEYNNYGLFAEVGYRLFSVPVLFSGKWISVTEGLKPFHSGIFDIKGSPDYSSFEHSVSLILEDCPDALVLPRVNISMPDWWIEENPEHLDSTKRRESLLSEKWKKDAGEFLRTFLIYLVNSEYADRIVGIQIAGGNTEEWFHFDLNGGCCKNAMPGFRRFLEDKYPDCPYEGIPDLSLLDSNRATLHGSEYLARYLEYSNNAVADAIAYFASIAKEVTERRIAIGTFYGYSLEVPSPLWGTHALKRILRCDDIDFICSPNSYIGIRDPETEWTEMYPADSVRLHGKLCMQECDIRTHITKPLPDAAPEYDPQRKMISEIWHGLASKEDTIKMIEKSFSRQLRKGNGFWWFDMWGGWYDDPDVMEKMRKFRIIYEKNLNIPDRKKRADVAVIVDEDAFRYMTDCSFRDVTYNQRKALGEAFADYDTYDISDFDEIKDRYRLFVFTTGTITEKSKQAVDYCITNSISHLCSPPTGELFTCEELENA